MPDGPHVQFAVESAKEPLDIGEVLVAQHDIVAAQRSDQALTKAARKRTPEDTPIHSFTSLLADLATLCTNQIQPADDMPAFTMPTSPTPLQRRAFELLDLSHRHGLA